MRKSRIILMSLLLYFILVSVKAETTSSQTLGTFQQNQPVELIQICSNQTSLCDLCNITAIKYPNSSIILSDVLMTKRSADFNYSLPSDYTTIIGTYLVNGYCQSGSEIEVWSYNFMVTPSGQEKANTGEGLTLIGLFFIIIVVSGFFLIMAWMSNNQIVKSMFIGLSAFIMAVVVFFGMTTITQILGGYGNLVTGYNTFFFFILLCIVMAVFTTLIIVLVKSFKMMQIKRGALDPRNFEMDGELG